MDDMEAAKADMENSMMPKPEEKCVSCGRDIYSNEGRYRPFGSTLCESCGDKDESIKTGIIL